MPSFKDLIYGGAGGILPIAGYNAYKGGAFDPQKLSSLDQGQQELRDQYQQGLTGGGGPFGDVFGFDAEGLREQFQNQFANPAYQNFQENTVPGITGAFRGQNLQNSSYLGGALGKAGTDVQKGLDSQLSKMLYDAQQASLGRKQKGVEDILNMQTFAYQDSPLMQLINSLAGGVGKAAGSYFGGG